MSRREWLDCYKYDVFQREDWSEQADIKSKSLPEVTLSGSNETGQENIPILVLKQQSYTGGTPVIQSSLADTPCANLGLAGLLEKLNTILGTSYNLEIPSLPTLLGDCITKEYDFGTAYGYLRRVWYDNLTEIEDKFFIRKARDVNMRKDVLVNKRILNGQVPPRRVWDLYSNRVVPWWVARRWPYPISHAWMDEHDRVNILTPINRHEWPVPIPKDVNLDLVRIEMLNLDAKYAWLDVLCLRQEHGRNESLRSEEWKLDVPTIGHVYEEADRITAVVCYFSGLGRPLSLKRSDFESGRSWFRRAWTLQEVSHNLKIGGETGEAMEEDIRERVEKELSAAKNVRINVFRALSEMQKRVSTNLVDRVAGMTYPLLSLDIPAYYEAQTEEDAWSAQVAVMSTFIRAELFLLYPNPGSGNKVWRPSWTQVMTESLPKCTALHSRGWVKRTEETDIDYFSGLFIESAHVRGLAGVLPTPKPRQGELVIKDKSGVERQFKIIAKHQYPIPEDSYALVGNDICASRQERQYWVVGQRLPDQMFKKSSVFEMKDKAEVTRLCNLGVARN
ncbi:hypothetical protein EDD18DRAFT_529393 [Armillaria luteobubalina]|uniref:Heterokaryon incompatibility domain-containing protein n=1 Tax=Armillaria luteobubalina TaxID=153913 RepID=A0AA39PWJ4_9AGAR|nr:hypothetical protein EDD18DRAFT_529393 [Armillaria luteobubalina]